MSSDKPSSDNQSMIPSAAADTDDGKHEVVRLVDPNPCGELDVEAELVGEEVPVVGLASPEEAAMHIEDASADDDRI